MRFRIKRMEKALTGSPSFVEALHGGSVDLLPRLGGSNIAQQRIGSVFVKAQSASYAYMYKRQPAVRSVVDYIARNTAQLGLRLYERVDDDERDHAGDHPAAESLRNPNPQTPGQQFIFNLVASFLIYDDAFALKFQGPGRRITCLYIPAHAVGIVGQDFFRAEAYRIYRFDGTSFDVSVDAMIHWRGYDPEEPRSGFSKLETLREELTADATARAAKTELDRAGLMPKGWIERPNDTPDWSVEARDRFMEDWANMTRNQGRKTPVLEESMVFKQAGVSPEDAQLLESRQFTKGEVAAIFGMEHCPPAGEEERRQFYADVLPPYCEMLCSYLDLQVLQQEYGLDDHYFEFNLDEKKMSDDRLKAITSAAGAPVLLRNEGRAMLNLPAVPDGDELVTPLNVIVGGKPSPQVMPIQDPNKPSQDGDFREDEKALGWNEHLTDVKKQLEVTSEPKRLADLNRQQRNIDKATGMMERHFSRVDRLHRNKGLVGVLKAFDQRRWDGELGDDIHRTISEIFEHEGGITVARLGGEDFDLRFSEHYRKAMSAGMAEAINDVTRRDIEELGFDDALKRARSERAQTAGAAIGARSTVEARLEAARQSPFPERRQKTWIAHTERHAAYDGVTVPLGADWPGGFAPGSPPNCRCSMTIS
jgi:HK97 family phage portal protein